MHHHISCIVCKLKPKKYHKSKTKNSRITIYLSHVAKVFPLAGHVLKF